MAAAASLDGDFRVGALAVGRETSTATILSDWFCVLKPEVVPECGGLIWRRHEGGSERDRGRMHAEWTVRDRRLDNEQTSTSDMHSDTSEY